MPQLFNKKGELVDVPHDKALEAVASGQYGMPKGARLNVLDDLGDLVSIGAKEANEAYRNGWTPESKDAERKRFLSENYGDTASEIAAGAAGLARGVSFGLTDPLLTGTGLVDKKTLGYLEEASPVISTVAEGAGMVLPSVVSGGSGLAAKVASKMPAALVARAGTSVAGKVSAKVLAATAPQRVASAVSKGIAQTILTGGAKAGGGAIARAAAKTTGGVVFKGLASEIVKKSGHSLAGRVMASAASMAAAGVVEGAAYGAGETVTEFALGDPEEAADNFFANVGMNALMGGVGGAVLGMAAPVVGAAAKKLAEKVGDTMPDSVGGFKRKLLYNASDIGAHDTKKLRRRGRLAGVEERLEEYVEKGLWEGGGENLMKVAKAEADELGAAIGAIRKQVSDQSEMVQVGALQRHLKKKLLDPIEDSPSKAKLYKKIKKIIKQEIPIFGDEVSIERMMSEKVAYGERAWNNGQLADEAAHELSGALEDIAEYSIERHAGADVLSQYKDIKRRYGPAADIVNPAGNVADREARNNLLSFSDKAMGAAHFAGTVAQGGDFLDTVTGGIKSYVAAAGNKVVREKGAFYAAAALSHFEKANLAAGKSIAKSVAGFAGRTAKSASIMSPLAVPLLASGSDKPRRKDVPKRTALAYQRIEELKDIQARGIEHSERIHAALDESGKAAPRIAAGLAKRAVKAASIALRNAPVNPRPMDAFGREGKWVPSEAALGKFERTLKAIGDPLSVLDDVANRRLSLEGAEVLREVFPSLGRKVAEKIQEQVLDGKIDPDNQQLITLSLLLGIPMTETMQPSFIRMVQGNFQPGDKKGGPGKAGGGSPKGKGPGGVRLSGINKLDLGSNNTTTTQQLTAGEK